MTDKKLLRSENIRFRFLKPFAVCLLLAGTALYGQTPAINYGNGFSSSSGLSLNGGATVSNDRLHLTDTSTGIQTRSAFASSQVDVSAFATTFEFETSEIGAYESGGMAFVIQRESASAVGDSNYNGSTGDNGISNSYSFQIKLEDEFAPPYQQWVGNGVVRVRMAYDGSVLRVIWHSLETGAQFSQYYTVDIPNEIGGSSAWVGFTAATGTDDPQERSDQEVLNWTFHEGSQQLPPLAKVSVNGTRNEQMVGAVLRIRQGDTLSFSGEESYAIQSGDSISAYSWDFGDGSSGSGATAGHTYNSSGTFTATLQVTDNNSNTSAAVPTTIEVDASLTPVVETDRLSGPAPLSVTFDATKTEGLAQGDYVNATFRWNFDSTGVDSDTDYEEASAMVAGHLYTEPGTYTVTLDVTDREGNTASTSVQVTVTDFENLSGLDTYYFASNGNDSNPGTESQPKQTLSEAVNLSGPNVRILFRQGDVWTHSRTDLNDIDGPLIWSSYEDSSNPSGALPTIRSTDVDGAWHQLYLRRSHDIRFINLRLEATGNTNTGPRYPGGFFIGENSSQILLLGCEIYNIGHVAIEGSGSDTVFVQDCHAWDFGPYFSYVGSGTRTSYVGNYVHDIGIDKREHVIRVQSGHQTYIAFNEFKARDTKSNIQIRGQNSNSVIYDNILDRVTSINPQNSSNEEYQHHHVVDSNLFLYRPEYEGENGFGVGRQALGTGPGSDIVVRNNRSYNYERFTGAGDHPLVGNPHNRWYYNNSAFVDRDIDASLMRVRNVEGTLNIQNNIYYSTINPSENVEWTAVLEIHDITAATTIDHNLLYNEYLDPDVDLFIVDGEWDITPSEWQGMGYGTGSIFGTEPAFESLDEIDADFLYPTSSSVVVDAGTPVPVAEDLTGYARPQGQEYDMGAWERGTGTPDSQPVISTTSLPNATEGQSYSATVQVSGGDGTLSWSLTGAPSWLSINQSGQLSGTPSSSGTANLTATVTDADNDSDDQALDLTVDPASSGGGGTSGIDRAYWTGISGVNVSDLTSDPDFPSNPDGMDVITSGLEGVGWTGSSNPGGSSDLASSYGQRMYGYLVAPTTGDYTFWLAADNRAELYLSTDSSPGNATKISEVTVYTGYREWDAHSAQKSITISLTAGEVYYIEVLHKEHGGGDHCSVGWAKPGESTTAPSEVIPGSVLYTYSGGVPSSENWTGQDVGSVGAAGSVNHSSGTFTVEGSGSDIWGSADEFHFVTLDGGLSGDGAIEARVSSLENTNYWAKAGVMIRDGFSADAKHAMTVVSPGNGLAFQRRTSTGGSSNHTGVSGSAPEWVRIERSGNTFTSYVSSDGQSWSQIGSAVTIGMDSNVEIGLCVTSHNDGTLCEAVFDNVTVE